MTLKTMDIGEVLYLISSSDGSTGEIWYCQSPENAQWWRDHGWSVVKVKVIEED